MSRPKRWAEALSNATAGVQQIKDAMDEITELRDEYQEWLDNLPENLQDGPTAEKLNALIDSADPDEVTYSVDELEGQIDELGNVDFPLGFGRD